MEQYRPRIADQLLEQRLRRIGAVLVQGPKWCGKTTTAERQAASTLYMADPDMMDNNLQLASLNVRRLLQGAKPRLIDEWQIAPRLWDAVRFEVDHTPGKGQFVLTGSSVPPRLDEIFHSGTGRFSKLTMRPMSLFESGDSTGQVSLARLFESNDIEDGCGALTIDWLAYLICRGGWPASLELEEEDALGVAMDYYDVVTESDMTRADGIERDPQRVQRLMRSYARHQGAGATVGTILADMRSNESSDLSDNTIYDYLKALKRIFVVEDMAAWNPNIRSKTAIRTSDTRYFVDSSIGTAALGLGPADLVNDLQTMGLFFETMCVRDLRVYADALGGQVFHYRDKNGLECDAVVHLRNGAYGLVEIKLGGTSLIEDGAKNLKSLASIIDTDRMKAPAFLMVLVGIGQYAYKREDGVLVVPVDCLKV